MSGFTALNGASLKPEAMVNGTSEPDRVSRPAEAAGYGDARDQDRLPLPGVASFTTESQGSQKRKRSIDDEPRRERERFPSPPYRPENEQVERAQPEQKPAEDSRGDEHWRNQQPREDREGTNPTGSSSAPANESAKTSQQADGEQGDKTSPDAENSSGVQRKDGVQSDPKKRKRNFSNRTKTGCLTCRKRKKKCDELKPECNNCYKGGFVCAGYPPQRGTWTKPESKPAQVNIESKDPNYVPPGAYSMPQQPAPPPPPPPPSTYSAPQSIVGQQPPKRDTLPYNRGQPTLRITTPAGRPLQSDDERTASTMPSSILSPENKLSALSAYTSCSSANVFPTPVSAAVSAFSDRTPKEYQRVPPLHDLTRTEPDQQSSLPPPQSSTLTHSPYSIVHGGRPESTPASQPPSISSQSTAPGGSAQTTAQLALSHSQYPQHSQRREKEEMLAGRQYYPFDRELVLERERCNAACWRFNNSTNPNLGVSPTERARLFRDILQPRDQSGLSPTNTSPVTAQGRVGENIVVEAPFNCDYGYNIKIGNNVLIYRNCYINDVCEVRIGNNVIISPFVCIYTGRCSTNPRNRLGTQGTQHGKPVVIEDDVWIGANAIILPGVTIGKGSTVGAGSIVTKDVPKWSIWMGRAASYRRGIDPQGTAYS